MALTLPAPQEVGRGGHGSRDMTSVARSQARAFAPGPVFWCLRPEGDRLRMSGKRLLGSCHARRWRMPRRCPCATRHTTQTPTDERAAADARDVEAIEADRC